MKPYNNNILVIDDKAEEIKVEVIEPLQRMSFQVEIQTNPESGRDIANHRYSVILIDFKFDLFPHITGSTLCEAIRKKCPLSTIILITAFGKEHFEQFTSYPWDGCFEKGKLGVLASQLDERIKNRLDEAVRKRYATELPHYFLTIPDELDLINKYSEILDKIEKVYQEKTNKRKYTVTEMAKKIKNTRSNLSQIFQIQEDSGTLTKKGLVIRHILMNEENLERWEKTKSEFEPLQKIIDFYRI